jgi:hypothetical protein
MYLVIGKVLHAAPRVIAFLPKRLQAVHQILVLFAAGIFIVIMDVQRPDPSAQGIAQAKSLSFRI